MNTPAQHTAIPEIGLGTFRLQGQVVIDSVTTGLDVGYRHIDTAQIYGNEAEVGPAIAASAVPRDALFVTTKIWIEPSRMSASSTSTWMTIRTAAAALPFRRAHGARRLAAAPEPPPAGRDLAGDRAICVPAFSRRRTKFIRLNACIPHDVAG